MMTTVALAGPNPTGHLRPAQPSNAHQTESSDSQPHPPSGTEPKPGTPGIGAQLADGATLLGAQESVFGSQMSDEEKQEISSLKKRDAEVRQHERAHASAGGQFAGSPSFSYERGPDGRSYAVGGEVPIDVSPVPGDPEATVRKMQMVQRAALAPSEPSRQDRAIAARAASHKLQAQAELAKQRTAELREALSGTMETEGLEGGAFAPTVEIFA